MLDFHFWNGIESKNISDLKLEYVDGIGWGEFIRLRFFGEECEKYGIFIDYYEDSFFNRDQVEILYLLCRNRHRRANEDFFVHKTSKKPSMTLYSHLLGILQKIYDSGKSLCLLCD
jgi:hypothetical protein